MKKFISLVLLLCMLTSAAIPITAQAALNPSIMVNGKLLSNANPAIIVNGTTIMPFRDVFEVLGFSVNWDGQRITGTNNSVSIVLTPNSKVAYVNGAIVTLEQPVKTLNYTNYVPVRFVVEAVGGNISYDKTSNIVNITTKITPPPPPPVNYQEQKAREFLWSGVNKVEWYINEVFKIWDLGLNYYDEAMALSELMPLIDQDIKYLLEVTPYPPLKKNYDALLNAFVETEKWLYANATSNLAASNKDVQAAKYYLDQTTIFFDNALFWMDETVNF